MAAAKRLPDRLGRKVGRYRGCLFRSVWEYSFYRHLESLGVSLEDVEYEPVAIPYVIRGKKRTYHPDLLVKSLGILYEVKSEREMGKKRGCRIRAAKFAAATAYALENGIVFKVVTEKDFPIVKYAEAYADVRVQWIKR